MATISLASSSLKIFQPTNMLRSVVFLVIIVAASSDNVRIKRAKYYSYPSRFYRKPPPPHVVKGAFSYTPPPNYMHDDDQYKPKVSKRPTNDGLGEEDINNLIKHLTKKDLDKIIEFAGEKERYTDNYREDSNEKYEYKPGFRRPERNAFKNEDVEQFALNIHHFREPDEMRRYKVEYNDQNTYAGVKPRILNPTPPTYPDDFDKPNSNYIDNASQTKVIYSNPPDNYNTKNTYSNHQESQFNNIPKSNSFNRGYIDSQKNAYINEDVEKFGQNIHHLREPDEMRRYKVENNDQNTYTRAKPTILHPTPPTYPDDIDNTSQTKVIYSNPPDNYNTKITYSNHQESQINNIPTSNSYSRGHSDSQIYYSPSFSNSQTLDPNTFNQQGNTPLDTEESMRQYEYISYVTIPPNRDIQENIYAVPPEYNKDSLFTDSGTMKEEQLPRPLNLRDDYEVANTNNVPKVVKSEGYSVESFKDLPLMNHDDSKLHTVSSYNVPHYLVTSTKSQQPPRTQPSKPSYPAVQIETAPPGYTGKEMSDAHLKAVKIWTHRSKGAAYTLHDDGTLSLEKPKIRTSYGYTP